MIVTHINFFLIAILVEFILEHPSVSGWNNSKYHGIDALIFFVFLAIRLIYNNINMFTYFSSYPFNSKD
jgi:hypothetical protein